MQLPFPVGQTWQANGPHPHNGVSGTRNSVDLGKTDNTTGTVVAVAAGTVSRLTNCGGGYEIRIDHASGWQSGYYHLASASIAKGDKVSMGQKIGTTGQGCGSATFKHVHFSLRRNGTDVNIDGLNIGGHTVRAKSYNYGGYWIRNSDGARVAEDAGGYARCCLKSLAVTNDDPRGHYDLASSPEAGRVRV
ncbi:MAG: M23 family metallopeptidase, partial [Thermoleophilaceae bacterium]